MPPTTVLLRECVDGGVAPLRYHPPTAFATAAVTLQGGTVYLASGAAATTSIHLRMGVRRRTRPAESDPVANRLCRRHRLGWVGHGEGWIGFGEG